MPDSRFQTSQGKENAKKYLKDKFSTKNAIQTRDKCFHLYLNENYKIKEAIDIVKSIKKIENYYS